MRLFSKIKYLFNNGKSELSIHHESLVYGNKALKIIDIIMGLLERQLLKKAQKINKYEDIADPHKRINYYLLLMAQEYIIHAGSEKVNIPIKKQNCRYISFQSYISIFK